MFDLMTDELSYLNKISKVDPVLLDVGANIVDFTFYFLHKFPKGKSICFEPNDVIYERLRSRFKNDPRVNIYNFGLSNTDTKDSKFFYVKNSIGMSSLHYRPAYFNEFNTDETSVDLIMLDSIYINFPRIDYMKIDTEGHEWFVLQGANKFLSDYSPKFIQFEVGGCYLDSNTKFVDIVLYLNSFNYKIYNEQDIEITSELATGNYEYKNYLAVKC